MNSRSLAAFISWRNILLLLVFASLMQTINVSISWLVQKKGTNIVQENKRQESFNTADKFNEVLKSVLESSIVDISGKFRFINGVLEGSSVSKIHFSKNRRKKSHGVTLVTQCSLSRLHHLIGLSEIWQGPISVAVLLLSYELSIGIQYFVKLRKCFKSVGFNVTLSVVYPEKKSSDAPEMGFDHDLEETPCDHLPYLSLFNKANYEQKETPYPNNLLRNVAIRSVTTGYSLVLDIDMVPSAKLHKTFIDYTMSKNFVTTEKVVWVLPAYEIQDGLEPPRNKTSLLLMKKTGEARPFYQELCSKCQIITDYQVWENEKVDNLSVVKSAYEVFWRDPWEPFFISGSEIHLYDERFQQYGFNRISQVCELHVAGYRFLVLDSAFVVHLGFKRKNGLHRSKDAEQERNRILYRQFKTDLKVKYPQSSRRCY